MKYFICTFGQICLGFPAQQTARIIQIDRMQRNICETSGRETFISLPALLRENDTSAPYGLVLKSSDAAAGCEVILLTPKIDIELDIPQERISRLPDVYAGVFSFFSGAFFSDSASAGESSEPEVQGFEYGLILLLNLEKITELLTKLPAEIPAKLPAGHPAKLPAEELP